MINEGDRMDACRPFPRSTSHTLVGDRMDAYRPFPRSTSHTLVGDRMDACPLFRRSTTHTSGRNGHYDPNHRRSTQTRALLACPHGLAEAPGKVPRRLEGQRLS